MPTLKQLTCTLEKEPSRSPLKEYNTNYHDGFVETYVAVPEERTGFSIHLKSSGYIAPGLAMFVYIDGVYQCNRHRQNLIPPDGTIPSDFYEASFRVLQKEEKTGKGQFIGRAWSFDSLNIATADKAPNVDDAILGNLGTIEVVVLRVLPPSAGSTPAATVGLLPARPANGSQAKPTSEKTGKAGKQKAIKIKPKIIPGPNGLFDGAGDDVAVQNFGASFDGPHDDRYYDRAYDYDYYDYDDRDHRPHYHNSFYRRASPSPPPRHDFGPSYADYLRWRDTHPDAAVPSRGRVAQRSSSYYEQYRPIEGEYSRRRRVRASDGDRFPHAAHKPAPPLTASHVTEGDRESEVKSEADRRPRTSGDASRGAYSTIDTREIPQARASDEIPNRSSGHTPKGYASYRAGQVDESLASSNRPDPMYNTRYAPEASSTHRNCKTNSRDGDSKMPGSWVGQDPKESVRAPDPNPNPFDSRSNRGESTVPFPPLDNIRWDVGNEQKGQSSGRDPAASNGAVAGQDGGDNGGGQNTGGWGGDNDWVNSDQNCQNNWNSDGSGGADGGNGGAQGGDGSKAADSNTQWGPTNTQEQTSQPTGGNFGAAEQDTGANGNWAGNSAGDNTGNQWGNDTSGSAANTADQSSQWPAQGDGAGNAADSTGSQWDQNNTAQDGASNWPAQTDNSAQQTTADNKWSTPEDNNAQQTTADSNWPAPTDNDAQQAPSENKWPAPTDNSPQQAPAENNWNTDAAATAAPAQQFPAVASKAGSSHKAGSSNNNKPGSKAASSSAKPLVPEQPFIKSYWQNTTAATVTHNPPAIPHRQPKDAPDAATEIFAPSEAPYVVPEHTKREKLVDSYVHHGKAYGYAHATGRPAYMDSLEQPYAVFRFKYRSGEMLARILGRRGREEVERERAREREEERKRKLSLLSKDELIQQLVGKKEAEAKSKAGSQQKAASAGGSHRWKAPSVAASQPKPVNEWVNEVAAATGSAGKSASGSDEPMSCDRCNTILIAEWWSCDMCGPDGDSYDICCRCVENKVRCKDSSHDLIKMQDNVDMGNGIKGPQPVNETLRGIPKESKSKKGGNAGGGSVANGSKKNGSGGNNNTANDNSNWAVDGKAGATGGADNGGGWTWNENDTAPAAADTTTPAAADTIAGGGWDTVDVGGTSVQGKW